MLTTSRRIDKFPTPGQRLSNKFPTTGTDKMTNMANKYPGGVGDTWARLELTEPLRTDE